MYQATLIHKDTRRDLGSYTNIRFAISSLIAEFFELPISCNAKATDEQITLTLGSKQIELRKF